MNAFTVNVDQLPELAEIRDRVCRAHGLQPEGHRLVIYGRKG